jgi:hypothetical protein
VIPVFSFKILKYPCSSVVNALFRINRLKEEAAETGERKP